MATKAKPKQKSAVYSVLTAARAVGLSPATVRTYCTRGDIGEAHEVPGSNLKFYTLSDGDLAWLRDESNRPKGRPPERGK